jgi:hypothetical protein
MPTTEQFWQYAKEAMLSADEAKTDEDRQRFLDLARTWTQAAIVERQLSADRDRELKLRRTARARAGTRVEARH